MEDTKIELVNRIFKKFKKNVSQWFPDAKMINAYLELQNVMDLQLFKETFEQNSEVQHQNAIIFRRWYEN